MANSTVVLSEEYSHYLQQFFAETPAQQTEFLTYCARPLRKSFRINTLVTHPDNIHSAFSSYMNLTPVPWFKRGYWYEGNLPCALGNLGEHLCGAIYIQEASSMLPVQAMLLNNTLPEQPLLLDMASAPGSKTTQLACELGNKGLIVANELSASRIKGLFSNIQRCAVTNTLLTHYDASIFGQQVPEMFDGILLDAPCSGEGTVRKDPDALKRWRLQDVLSIAHVQKQLIESAFLALKPGGVLIYSTCTLNHYENQQICYHLQQTFGDAVEFESLENLFEGSETALTPEGFLHVLPHYYDSEGFFIARIRKRHSVALAMPEADTVQHKKRKHKKNNFPYQPIDRKTQQQLADYLLQHFGFAISTQLQQRLWIRDNNIWLFPADSAQFIGKLHLDRIGVKVAEIHKKELRLQHDFAIAFGQQFCQNCYTLSADEAKSIYQGQDISPENIDSLQGDILLVFKNYPVALGKRVQNRIKNKLPRELVKDNPLFI